MKALIKKIESYNKKLTEAIEYMCGENQFYDVDSTCVGGLDELHPIEYKQQDGKLQIKWDGEEFDIGGDDGYPEYLFEDDLKYCTKRIKKTLKVWESENPDKEEESEKNEEDNE